ncbi:hypothetical protein D3C76_1829440 [compost metagenome]
MIEQSASVWVKVRDSPRNTIPDMAARAGSMLIRVPKMRVGRRVRAIISRE